MSFGNIFSNFGFGDDDNFSIIIIIIVLFLLFGSGGFGGLGTGFPFGGLGNNLGCCEPEPCCCKKKHHHKHDCCCENYDPCLNRGYQNDWSIWLILIILFLIIGESQENCDN